MSLKNNLLKVIDSALELAKNAPQTIEVRGAIKQLTQAKGSISMSRIDNKDITPAEIEPVVNETPEEVLEDVIEGAEETAVKIDVVDEEVVIGED